MGSFRHKYHFHSLESFERFYCAAKVLWKADVILQMNFKVQGQQVSTIIYNNIIHFWKLEKEVEKGYSFGISDYLDEFHTINRTVWTIIELIFKRYFGRVCLV